MLTLIMTRQFMSQSILRTRVELYIFVRSGNGRNKKDVGEGTNKKQKESCILRASSAHKNL